MAQNEDLPYNKVQEFATPDKEKAEERPSLDYIIVQALKKNDKYLDEAIAEHDTMQIIDLEEKAKMTPTQQIAVHKLVINHLQNIRTDIKEINSKVKELQ